MSRTYDEQINARVLRAVLADMVDMLGDHASIDPEVESVKRDKWHFARMLTGRTGDDWDADAAVRGRRWYL